MNKLKEQLRLRMLGQLSDEKTQLDIDTAYGDASARIVEKKELVEFLKDW